MSKISKSLLSIGQAVHSPGYRFERGAELGFWTLGFLVTGQVHVQTPEESFSRVGPTVSITPPHCPYTSMWDGGEVIWAIFDPPMRWGALLDWPQVSGAIGEIKIDQATDVQAVKTQLLEGRANLLSDRPNGQLLALSALERALLLLDEINPARGRQRRDPRISQVLEYIAHHYDQPLDVRILAKAAHLSPSWFAHLFCNQMGIGAMQYVERYRLDRAAERLLGTSDSVEQVARYCGFENPFHFSTRFRRRFDQPPSRYRINPHKLEGFTPRSKSSDYD